MKGYARPRTGTTRTHAGPAKIKGSTFGNHVRIFQGNLNIFKHGRNTHFSPDDQPVDAVQAQLKKTEKTDCQRSLVFRDIDARLHNISPVQPGTCEWVFELPLFQKWYDHTERDNGLLWIKGNPGTGKSTLMKHIFQYCQSKEKYVIAAYFFNARGAELEQTPLGMLRSLLFQLIKNEPRLYHQFLPLFRKKREEFMSDDWEWREPELKGFFLSEIPKCEPAPLLLIIDALDECSDDDVEKVARFLQDLRNNAVDAGLTLKICLSSRHYPFIRFKAHQKLVLENEKQHDEDIAKYISSNLTKRDEEIEEAIRKKSSGIFLWIVLVITMLNRAYQDGKVEGMKDRLNEIPSALGEVFAMMLDKNNPDKNETILILQCVLFAKRLLTPEEIYFAVIAGTNSQALSKWDPLQITPDIIRRRIISSSRGLVEIRKGKNESTRSIHRSDNNESFKSSLQRRDLTEEDETVQFIHGSVNDFLVRNRRLQELDPELMPNPIAKSHDRLKDCCLSYLMMGPLELQNSKELVSSFPFLEYASSYLFDHAEEGTSVGQTELLRTLEDNEVFERVEYFHSSFVDYHHNGAPLNLLQVLAALELPKLVVTLLDRGADINAPGNPIGTALETAIAFESEETVRTLLSKGAEINSRGGYSDDTALMRAFWIGNRRIVAALIERGAKLSIWERILIGSMLSQAVSCGDEDIVARMLDNGAKVNAGGSMVGNPLAVAALKGQKDIAEMLLARGAKINAVRGLFGTALGAAAVRGHMEVAEMLLEKGANIDKRGLLGSPLQVAAAAGQKEAVEMLLDKGANVNVQGPLYGNALHVAAKRGDKEIVEMLLKKGANINSRAFIRIGGYHEDAMDSNEARIQQMLLKKGIKMRRTWGKVQYGTALKAAAVNRRGEVVRLLLDRGAKC